MPRTHQLTQLPALRHQMMQGFESLSLVQTSSSTAHHMHQRVCGICFLESRGGICTEFLTSRKHYEPAPFFYVSIPCTILCYECTYVHLTEDKYLQRINIQSHDQNTSRNQCVAAFILSMAEQKTAGNS